MDRQIFQGLGQLPALVPTCVGQGHVIVAVQAHLGGIGGFAMAQEVNPATGLALHLACIGVGRYERRHKTEVERGSVKKKWRARCPPFILKFSATKKEPDQ